MSKKFLCATALIVISFLTATLFASTGALAHSDSAVQCTKKYQGILKVVTLATGKGLAPQNDTVSIADDDAKTLTIDKKRVQQVSLQFRFDVCVTMGWNEGHSEYGLLKPVPLADMDACVTVSTKAAPGQKYNHGEEARELYLGQCAPINTGILAQQWFFANHVQAHDGKEEHVELILTGNPNQPSDTDRRPQIDYFDDEKTKVRSAVTAAPIWSPFPATLVLYDITTPES